MALARVVTFEGVGTDRMERMRSEVSGQEQPEGLRATEMLVLHDPDAEKAIAILIFDNEEDYASGDAVLNAMPAGDTPGRRTSITTYEVAVRIDGVRGRAGRALRGLRGSAQPREQARTRLDAGLRRRDGREHVAVDQGVRRHACLHGEQPLALGDEPVRLAGVDGEALLGGAGESLLRGQVLDDRGRPGPVAGVVHERPALGAELGDVLPELLERHPAAANSGSAVATSAVAAGPPSSVRSARRVLPPEEIRVGEPRRRADVGAVERFARGGHGPVIGRSSRSLRAGPCAERLVSGVAG